MDSETEVELLHSKNARLNQDIRIGEMAKDIIGMKKIITELEFQIYELKKLVKYLKDPMK